MFFTAVESDLVDSAAYQVFLPFTLGPLFFLQLYHTTISVFYCRGANLFSFQIHFFSVAVISFVKVFPFLNYSMYRPSMIARPQTCWPS